MCLGGAIETENILIASFFNHGDKQGKPETFGGGGLPLEWLYTKIVPHGQESVSPSQLKVS